MGEAYYDSVELRPWFEEVCGSMTWRGHEGTGRCPLATHGGIDKHPSFTVNSEKGTFFCHKEQQGGGVKKLAELVGATPPESKHRGARQNTRIARQIEAIYDYKDSSGKLLYQILRYKPKNFAARRPDPSGKTPWLWTLEDSESVPYCLPELLAAQDAGQIVFVVEGEKDANRLQTLQITATCCHGGSGRWRAAHSQYFRKGSHVVVIPDNDPKGHEHASSVSRQLITRGCKVLTLNLPDQPLKGDVSDWLDRGGTQEELLELVRINDSESGIPRTDLGNAERLVARHGEELRFCRQWNKWLVWDKICWKPDETGAARRMAAGTIRALQQEAECIEEDKQRQSLINYARRCESAQRLQAMMKLAEDEQTFAITSDVLDADPWMINFANGTLDLRGWNISPHDPSQLITKLAPVTQDDNASCPEWFAFLDRIFAGKSELIYYVQKAVGYSLTGQTGEQCLFLLYGKGANGKSTFISTIMAMLGNYAKQMPMNSLLVKNGDGGVPNDIAALKGARFISATEADEGKRLAESLIKQLTGQDRISARFMRSEWFEFLPEFKLWLATNHKPVIRGGDEAMWRRVHLIPFEVTIPLAERDPKLVDKLKAELPGILNWAIEGCQAWQVEGLKLPPEVAAATDEYRAEMDVVGEFLLECCCENPLTSTSAGELYRRYDSWCITNAERPLSKRFFARRMKDRGFESRRSTGNQLVWDGVGIAQQASDMPVEQVMEKIALM